MFSLSLLDESGSVSFDPDQALFLMGIWIHVNDTYPVDPDPEHWSIADREGDSTVGVIYLERDKSLEQLTLHAYFLHLKLKILIFFYSQI